jgi:hypothetical protein
MNIFQCCFALYKIYREPTFFVNRISTDVADKTPYKGYILHISRPDTIVMRTKNSMIKKYVKIDGIHTPKINLNDNNERAAAIYAMKQMKYKFIEKYAVVDDTNGDVICGNENIKTWMLMNRIAVANNEPVPHNWIDYIHTGRL